MALFRRTSTSAAEIIERLPVWRALSQIYIPVEHSSADFDDMAARLAVSPFSEEELLRILFGEVHPWLMMNLFEDPIACHEDEVPDDTLLERLIPRIGRSPFPGPRVFFRRWINNHVAEILARLRPLRAQMAASRAFTPKRPNDDYIIGIIEKDGATGAIVDPETGLTFWDKVTTYRKLSVPLIAWRRVYGSIENAPLVVSDIQSPSYFNDHLKRIQADRMYLMRVRFRADSTVELVALLDEIEATDAALEQIAADRRS